MGSYALKSKPNPRITYLYNTVVFGIIFYQAVFNYEILSRFAMPCVSLYFIVLGYSLSVLRPKKKQTTLYYTRSIVEQREQSTPKHFRLKGIKNLIAINSTRYYISLVAILLCLILYWGRWLFFFDNEMVRSGFVWN